MKIRLATRAITLASVLLAACGTLVAVAPPAPAVSDLTVVWPEITSFNADETEYVIDVQGETSGRLLLSITNDSHLAYQQLDGTGVSAVSFPTADTAGAHHLRLYECPKDAWNLAQCVVVGSSPTLDVTPSAAPVPSGAPATVVWPEETAFNPDLMVYGPEVTWDGIGSLYLTPRYGGLFPVRVDAGTNPIDFPHDSNGGTWAFDLYQCPGRVFEMPACGLAGQSPQLEVWRAMDLRVGSPFKLLGPGSRVDLDVANSPVWTVDVDWQILDAGTVVAQGAAENVNPVLGSLPPIGEQAALVHGHEYEFRATTSSDTPTYGHLEQTASYIFRWDGEVRAALGLSSSHFYPAPDRYRDSVYIKVAPTAGEKVQLRSARIEITDPAGDVVLDRTLTRPFGSYGYVRIGWNGQAAGELAPEGRYKVTAAVTDYVRNTDVFTEHVMLTHERSRLRKWRYSVTPKASQINSGTGSCGDLVGPARPGWVGSIGLRSHRCARADESYAATVHGIYLPDPGPNPTSRTGFREVWLRALGGHARGSLGSKLWFYYLRDDGRWSRGSRFGSPLRWHGGWSANEDYVLDSDHDPRPHFIWDVGVSGSNSYDVRRFEVVAYYWVFE